MGYQENADATAKNIDKISGTLEKRPWPAFLVILIIVMAAALYAGFTWKKKNHEYHIIKRFLPVVFGLAWGHNNNSERMAVHSRAGRFSRLVFGVCGLPAVAGFRVA